MGRRTCWSALVSCFIALLSLTVPICASDVGTTTNTGALAVQKTADDLNTPVCDSDEQCVIGGVCRKDSTGKKRCMCSSSCLMTVPLNCAPTNPVSCLTMGEDYVRKYNTSTPTCFYGRCVCPPQFDPIPTKSGAPGVPFIPPFKCDKRDLDIMMAISPADSVYKGTEVNIYCCINMDPRRFVPEGGVYFVQNNTRKREPSQTPYEMFTSGADSLFTVPTCWSLTISNVQLSDSGSYSCIVQSVLANARSLNQTMYFTVKSEYGLLRPRTLRDRRPKTASKSPRMIQNITIKPNVTEALVTWDTQEGPMLKISLQLHSQGAQRQEIWRGDNVKSPVQLTGLEPGSSYKLSFTVQDGHTFSFTEPFQTFEGKSHPPLPEDIRLANTVDGLQCEVEWRPPFTVNGHIRRYYVQLKGAVRYRPAEATPEADEVDFPPAAMDKCQNFDGSDDRFVDANHPTFLCKFGPLKPNRNYTATIWAENGAGKSEPVKFSRQCAMDFAEPNLIEPPETVVPHNESSFSLRFTKPPLETNGPIACYYLAVVPLPSNVSLQNLPKTEDIIMDSYEEAMRNNVNSFQSDRFYAYIAESYMTFPDDTVIGDNQMPVGVEPCNVLYLSRFKAEDVKLQSNLKYTGFLIVRVDRDKSLRQSQSFDFKRVLQPKFRRSRRQHLLLDTGHRSARQLSNSDPAYGFSSYFKPVYLEDGVPSGPVPIAIFVLLAIVGILAILAMLVYYLYHQGFLHHLCPDKKEHTLLRQASQPIAIDDLHSEFLMKQRDSEFLFQSEFDNLPKPKELRFTASEKRENVNKNRYQDIKATDDTRVKLKYTADGSDYINANFIRGYAGRKTFIAAQAPKPVTFGDFWQMVWEQDVRIVIMVANLIERGRNQVDKYWPNLDEEPIVVNGRLQVACKHMEQFAEYARRDFQLVYVQPGADNAAATLMDSLSEEPESDYANVPVLRPSSNNSHRALFDGDVVNKEVRRITHYHFTNWVDLKAPDQTAGIMRLMLKLRQQNDYNNFPVVVHCSAGVGRTGTYIAIDTVLDQMAAEGKADVFGTVSAMRYQRNATMVQSPEQYVFVYRAIVEHHLFGETDIPRSNFVRTFAKLRQTPRERRISGNSQMRMSSLVSYDQNGSPPSSITSAPSTAPLMSSGSVGAKLKEWLGGQSDVGKQTGLQAEFAALDVPMDAPKSVNAAHAETNAHKNRTPEAVPYDKYRVLLAPQLGSSSQYINATPFTGFQQRWVLTQDPLDADTCHDFWRLVDVTEARTLLMLSREEEFLPHERYWPEDPKEPVTFGKHLHVQLKSLREHPTFIERRLVYKLHSNAEVEVLQLCFTGWMSGAPTPASTHPLTELLLKVLARQHDFPDQPPVIVHSRDGSKEPGLAVCIASLLERLASEDMVDVFRTARSIRQHRPLVFPKYEQYEFVYDVMADYIRSS